MRCQNRRGTACQCKGDGRGGRCKFHGGKSTGPRTEIGRAKISAVQKDRWERWRATKNDRLLARLYGLLGMPVPILGGGNDLQYSLRARISSGWEGTAS